MTKEPKIRRKRPVPVIPEGQVEFTVRVSDQDWRALRKFAASQDRSLRYIVADILRRHVEANAQTGPVTVIEPKETAAELIQEAVAELELLPAVGTPEYAAAVALAEKNFWMGRKKPQTAATTPAAPPPPPGNLDSYIARASAAIQARAQQQIENPPASDGASAMDPGSPKPAGNEEEMWDCANCNTKNSDSITVCAKCGRS